MRKSKFTEEQIINLLKSVEAGQKTADVCRSSGISEQTYRRWKAKYGGRDINEARRLKQLGEENRRLKQTGDDLTHNQYTQIFQSRERKLVFQPQEESIDFRRLTFEEVKTLVGANKKTQAFTDECVIAVCWKESGFDPNAQSSGSTAAGLMQMTKDAIDTVNRITPQGIHFEHNDMFDPGMAIQCGTIYLQFCSDTQHGNEAKALDMYGTGPGYSVDVMSAEACLLTGGSKPSDCLKQIHSFQIERKALGLIDDLSGQSRFIFPTNSRP